MWLKVTKPLSGNFVLQNDDKTLGQVVVTGYTQTDVRKSTGSVSMISGKELNDAPLKNVDMLLQGKLTGVSVQAVSGKPGASAKIRVRGVSSITREQRTFCGLSTVYPFKRIYLQPAQATFVAVISARFMPWCGRY